MGRTDVLAMVDVGALIGHTSVGLETDEEVSFDETGDDYLAVNGIDFPGRLSPVGDHLLCA